MFALLIPIKGLCAEDPNKEKPGGDKQSGINLSGINLSEITFSDQEKKLLKKQAAIMKESGSAGLEALQGKKPLVMENVSIGDESTIYNRQKVGDLPTFKYDGGLSVSDNLRNIQYMLFALKPGERLAVENLNAGNRSRQEEFVDLVKKVPGIVLSFRFFARGVAVFKKNRH